MSFYSGIIRGWSKLDGSSRRPAPKNMTGVKNLRVYIALAALPEMKLGPGAPAMPEPGHRSHKNALSVRPKRGRKLNGITLAESDPVDNAIYDFMRCHMPTRPLDVAEPDTATGEGLTVPCSDQSFYVPPKVLGQPSDLNRITKWVYDYPLATVQRIMHLTFGQTRQWEFSEPVSDIDHHLVKTITWDYIIQDGMAAESSLVVIVQPPWIASAKDLESFVKCDKLPPLDATKDHNSPFNEFENNSQRLWAKIWDICSRRRCHHWVLTTYWGWVFGVFSPGRAYAQVCPIRAFDDTEPTVMEHLLYWVALSMDLNEREEVQFGVDGVEDIVMDDDATEVPEEPFYRLLPPPRSESSWSAATRRPGTLFEDRGAGLSDIEDDDEADEAEVAQMLFFSMGNASQEKVVIPTEEHAALVRENIANWRAQLAQGGNQVTSYHVYAIPGRSPYATLSTVSSSTVSSATSVVKDLGGTAQGSWLSSQPEAIPEE
ncbi:hypothetical protein NM688_g5862 [Phlebia brevispora]|uniref:Uncharacterized protein n=1 Tax=Phlebia brevispora TaxID=194682 RepID=A0ACC1SNP4_9APHY|nr:hypothetical protein NM688_g5862 [Phlebia brevispora]